MTDQAMSDYVGSLENAEKLRYNEKLRLINGIDPYSIKKSDWHTTFDKFPGITYPDIVNFLALIPSTYTMEDFKAYKSLDAYKYFACGWVRNVRTKEINNSHVIISNVVHTQSVRDEPLMPWVISSADGTIEAAHCTCIAGLSECCSHVAALLFYVEYGVRMREDETMGDDIAEKIYMPAPLTKEVHYARIADIDFSSAKAKQRKSERECKKKICEPSDKEISDFFTELRKCESKAAILTIIPDYSEHLRKQAIP